MARPVHKLLRKGKRELRDNKFRVTKLCAQAYVNNFGVCGAYCQETGLSLTKEVTTQTNRWKVWATKLAQNSVVCLAMRVGIRLTVPRERIGVGLVAVNEAHEVFMLRHVFHPYYQWGLPGGWLKKNEAPAAGVLRELWEDTWHAYNTLQGKRLFGSVRAFSGVRYRRGLSATGRGRLL